MADAAGPCIYVLAGPNGGGKSSVAGAAFRQHGADYFNPDEAARRLRAAAPHLTIEAANGAAWSEGKRLLETAIAGHLTFTFETTLGGTTMTHLLHAAIAEGLEVRIWYVALSSPAQHIARVHARVARGGHDIPEQRIRERYDRSRLNLIGVLPKLAELRLFDNSYEADPAEGLTPRPLLVLHMSRGEVVDACELKAVPGWAKPIVSFAMKLRRR